MNPLVSFYNNGWLFRCNKNEFDDNIKNVLTKLFSYCIIDRAQIYIFHLHNVKCIICLQLISTNINTFIFNPFLICDSCCNVCIGHHIFIEFFVSRPSCSIKSVWTNGKRPFYHGRGNPQSFIDHSHKLIHRFYHVVPIMFIMAISDRNSHCHMLNGDIMMHMLQFIY